jgi:hypothetical protein
MEPSRTTTPSSGIIAPGMIASDHSSDSVSELHLHEMMLEGEVERV